MSQTLTINELWEETERLRAKVEKLQQRLHSQEAPQEISAAEDIWSVWPYSWAQSGWNTSQVFCAERFHSLHRKLNERQLERRNRRAVAALGHGSDSTTLKLV